MDYCQALHSSSTLGRRLSDQQTPCTDRVLNRSAQVVEVVVPPPPIGWMCTGPLTC